MKSRILKSLLNNTGYTVTNQKEYIAVGSPLCHDLIKVDKATLKITYALDTWKEGRNCLLNKSNQELLFIWDKLSELIESGAIHDIINGDDEIENPLPVFTIDEDGALVKTFTDAYGYPNVTISGYMMYDNTFFKTKLEAIEWGIKDCGYGIKFYTERKEELLKEVQKVEDKIKKEQTALNKLIELKSQQ